MEEISEKWKQFKLLDEEASHIRIDGIGDSGPSRKRSLFCLLGSV